MRKELIQTESLVNARKQCPWACKFIRVEGGILCFESLGEYQIWMRQR